jgi:hypothetical protein
MVQPVEGIRAYAIRRLSRYLGVWHIMHTAHGMAVTANGIDWQVQVKIKTRTSAWGSLADRAEIYRSMKHVNY